jgi:uncharacterized membrane protein HdeD (DUF308 family)
MRLAQIGLGIIAIVLSIYVLASSPVLTLVTIALLIALVLFVVGIERIINGLFLEGKHRFTNVGLGIAVVVVSVIAMAFPIATGIFLLIFLAIALLFDGVSRVMHGVSDRSSHKASRVFSIVAGAIEIGLSVMIIASPIVGIQMITSGVIGRRLALQA